MALPKLVAVKFIQSCLKDSYQETFLSIRATIAHSIIHLRFLTLRVEEQDQWPSPDLDLWSQIDALRLHLPQLVKLSLLTYYYDQLLAWLAIIHSQSTSHL